MLIELIFDSEVPIYTQIKNAVMKGIATGDLSEGDLLPSVRQLASEIGINMHTVNKAYTELKNEGFIRVDRRKGAVVEKVGDNITEAYQKRVAYEIETMVSEAICRGVSEKEVLELVINQFEKFKG